MKKFIKKNLKWVIALVFLLIFLLLLEDIFDKEIINFDNYSYNLINKFKCYDFFNFITIFGSASILVILTFILFVLVEDKKEKISIPLNLIIISLFNYILKIIIKRPRPTNKLIYATGYSFPSGHSMISMGYYGFLIYLVYKSKLNKCVKIILISLLSLLIFLIGISRVYLRVHYMSDVIAGFSISISYLILFIHLEGLVHKKLEGSNTIKYDKI